MFQLKPVRGQFIFEDPKDSLQIAIDPNIFRRTWEQQEKSRLHRASRNNLGADPFTMINLLTNYSDLILMKCIQFIIYE